MMKNKEIRRVKTPVEPLEELKDTNNENLRRSGSYSIESLRNLQDANCNRTHNTNHYSNFKEPSYFAKIGKMAKNGITAEHTIKSKIGTQIGSPYLNKANHSQKNIISMTEKNDINKFRKHVDEINQKLNCISENTKSKIRNQLLDYELLKLPSIGHDEGISFIPTKPSIHSSNTTTKMNNQALPPEIKNDVKLQFNAILNKTRIDNLPPLQELSVFEQSFESRRKQTVNQPLRSRSKNYRNLDGESYIHSSQNGKNPKTAKLALKEDSIFRERSTDSRCDERIATEIYEPNIGRKTTKKDLNTNNVVIENSISVVSSIANK